MKLQSWADKRNDRYSRYIVKWIILLERILDEGSTSREDEARLKYWYDALKRYNRTGTKEQDIDSQTKWG